VRPTRWLAVALLLSACSERDLTQVVISIDAEPSVRARLVRVEAYCLGPDMVRTGDVATFEVGPTRVDFPFSFGAAPDATNALRVMVRGFDAADSQHPVIEHPVRATLDEGSKSYLLFVLSDACLDVDCPVGQRCHPGTGAAKPFCEVLPEERPSATPETACGVADGACPSGCAWPRDADCKRLDGVACESSTQCVSDHCAQNFCCNESCDQACKACNRPNLAGTCTDYVPPLSPAHCGGCGFACSSHHVPELHCSAQGLCDGTCERNWGDCDEEKLKNGCETDLQTSSDYCGDCGAGHACPYRLCRRGKCVYGGAGTWMGSGEVRWPANRMFGIRVPIIADANASGLGIRIGHGGTYPQGHVRVGLYDDDNGAPGDRLAHVGPTSTLALDTHEPGVFSVYGGFERALPQPIRLVQGTFVWMFAIADTDLFVVSEGYMQNWLTSPLQYDSLPEMPLAIQTSAFVEWPSIKTGNLYIVTTPL
jgi:hypothetical protein